MSDDALMRDWNERHAASSRDAAHSRRVPQVDALLCEAMHSILDALGRFEHDPEYTAIKCESAVAILSAVASDARRSTETPRGGS